MKPDPFFHHALDAHRSENPAEKVRLVNDLFAAMQGGQIEPGGDCQPDKLPVPGVPDNVELVHPSRLARRSPHTDMGRAALLHAIAHIEFSAINLALDALLRFREVPQEFTLDWLSVAWDEARHFQMVERRLTELGHAYGDFPAHNGLWSMAELTRHDPLARMAVVPRVLEARGLDVNPGMRELLSQAGDEASARILDVILEEEIRHVAIGNRWYHYFCETRGFDPLETFRNMIKQYCQGSLRGPFNHAARKAAGFTDEELAMLEAGLDTK